MGPFLRAQQLGDIPDAVRSGGQEFRLDRRMFGLAPALMDLIGGEQHAVHVGTEHNEGRPPENARVCAAIVTIDRRAQTAGRTATTCMAPASSRNVSRLPDRS